MTAVGIMATPDVGAALDISCCVALGGAHDSNSTLLAGAAIAGEFVLRLVLAEVVQPAGEGPPLRVRMCTRASAVTTVLNGGAPQATNVQQANRVMWAVRETLRAVNVQIHAETVGAAQLRQTSHAAAEFHRRESGAGTSHWAGNIVLRNEKLRLIYHMFKVWAPAVVEALRGASMGAHDHHS